MGEKQQVLQVRTGGETDTYKGDRLSFDYDAGTLIIRHEGPNAGKLAIYAAGQWTSVVRKDV